MAEKKLEYGKVYDFHNKGRTERGLYIGNINRAAKFLTEERNEILLYTAHTNKEIINEDGSENKEIWIKNIDVLIGLEKELASKILKNHLGEKNAS